MEKESVKGTPTRLTVELNHFVLHSVHWLTKGLVAACGAEGATTKIIDRDLILQVWGVLGIVKRALGRGLAWVDKELSEAESPSSVFHTSFTAIFTELEKNYSNLKVAQLSVEKSVGTGAKDYHTVSDSIWWLSLRLAVFLRDLTEVWMRVHGGLFVAHSTGLVLAGNTNVVEYIGALVAQIPMLEKKESESQVFITHMALLSSCFAMLLAAPTPAMRQALWGSNPSVTGQIHAVLMQRCLQYKNPNILQLSSYLSTSMLLDGLGKVGNSSLMLSSSQQLLDLLSERRDGASACAIQMLTLAVTTNPHALIPSLFRMLEAGPEARLNALDVLSSLPDIEEYDEEDELEERPNDKEERPKLSREKMRELLRILSQNLLLHLADEELVLRVSAGRLFSKVFPEDVVKPLLNISIQTDATGRKQSSAKKALQAVFTAHLLDGEFLCFFLKTAYGVVHETGVKESGEETVRPQLSSPADIYAQSLLNAPTDTAPPTGKEESKEKRISFLVSQLLREWGDQLASEELEVTTLSPLYQFTKQLTSFEEQEWFVKYQTEVFSYVSLSNVRNATVCVEKVAEDFTELSPDISSQWHQNILAGLENLAGMDTVYKVLFPLLCLRACAKHVYTLLLNQDCPPPVKTVYHSVLSAFLEEPFRSYFSAKVDVQRVLLEVLSRFPMEVVLADMAERVKEDPRTTLLVDRATIFILSTQVTSSFEEAPKPGDDRAVLLFSHFEPILQSVLQIVMDGKTDRYKNCELKEQAAITKLVESAGDCLAALTMFSVRNKGEMSSQEKLQLVLFTPLAELSATLRNCKKEGKSFTDLRVLQQCGFLLHSQLFVVRILQMLQKSSSLYVDWLEMILPTIVELSNSACVYVSGSTEAVSATTETLQNIAVQGCELLFHATMAAGKIEKRDSVQSPLLGLSVGSKQALVSFAIGTVRYTKFPLMQEAGVRLLSSLLGAAPELFTEQEESDAALREAVSALESVALMHSSTNTRRLADQVLHVLQESLAH
ncbi:hypothetical protein AGDE_12663 [Angomonas deanei]|uniref:Uncharacterized protein n=1 Tax=Angomonas deanei TaxID=59799 RepID=A0A7G2C5B6_9TRYP|nr:hypothetical protein AGDE_12663 [Angomonas deanei]CAD2214998.1 hypothetical protein, conserved [Angomonas deanei]|eukprot:EPY23881.1 hypothetical protein AGDE_12663 [Angomonas deanei]